MKSVVLQLIANQNTAYLYIGHYYTHSYKHCWNHLWESSSRICWKEWGTGPTSNSNLNTAYQIGPNLGNKVDGSIVHWKQSPWLELEKTWENISVEVLRKQAVHTAAKVDSPKINLILDNSVGQSRSLYFIKVMKWNRVIFSDLSFYNNHFGHH